MCGRFAGADPARAEVVIAALQIVKESPDLFDLSPRRYNIAPTQSAPIIRETDGRREMIERRWGLIPAWVKSAAEFKMTLINARCESVYEKASFRSLMRHRRCLVPAAGYYEWRVEGKTKTPHFIRARDGSNLLFAGLWDRNDHDAVESFTIITTDANDALKDVHDRMPVVIALDDAATWLNPDTDPAVLRDLLRPAPDDLLEHYAVSKAVNRPANDDPGLIEAVGG